MTLAPPFHTTLFYSSDQSPGAVKGHFSPVVVFPSNLAALGRDHLPETTVINAHFGQRVQFSVFEIEVDPGQWAKLKARLEGTIRPDVDSLRYYYLGANWVRKIEHVGAKPATDLNGTLIV